MDIEPETVEPLAIRPGNVVDVEDAPTAPAVCVLPADLVLQFATEMLLAVLAREIPPLEAAERLLDDVLHALPDDGRWPGAQLVLGTLALRGARSTETWARLNERADRGRL